MTGPMSTGPGNAGEGRAWNRNWFRASERRFDSRVMISRRRPCSAEMFDSARSTWAEPLMEPERVADLVGQEGGHLADSGELLLGAHLLLQALDVCQVLEDQQVTHPP